MAFFLSLIIALALMIVAYLIMPKPKTDTGKTQDLENPTADAGKPIPELVGTMTIKGLNCLGFWEKSYQKKKVKA